MKLVSKLALAAALAVPSFAMADAPNKGALTFSGGVDYSSNYYFRGYLQDNNGLILQPYFGISTNVHKSDDLTVNVNLQTWNSIHTSNQGSDGAGPGHWYENDIYLSADFIFGKFTVSPAYNLYQYPNGAFESIQEFAVKIAYDDTGLIQDVLLKPYIYFAKEIDDGNGSEDFYWEAGITPTYNLKIGQTTLPLSLPILVAGSLDGYYTDTSGHNSNFGYGSIGVTTSYALPVPESYGAWSLNGGITWTYLFADSVDHANGNNDNYFTAKVGVSFTY